DFGLVEFSEPSTNLLTQGMVLNHIYSCQPAGGRKRYFNPAEVEARRGADAARLFTMFASPPEQTLEWSDEGVQGAARFIRRLWNAVYEHVGAGAAPALDTAALSGAQRSMRRATHQALAKATDDIGRRRNFNTA